MHEHEWISNWIDDLTMYFNENEAGLVTAVTSLLHNRNVKKILAGMCLHTHTLQCIVFSCILDHNCDFVAALEVATNIKDTLSVIKSPERYSGVSASILKASVGESSHILPISRLLEVWFTDVSKLY
jgi:hypothetical protein